MSSNITILKSFVSSLGRFAKDPNLLSTDSVEEQLSQVHSGLQNIPCEECEEIFTDSKLFKSIVKKSLKIVFNYTFSYSSELLLILSKIISKTTTVELGETFELLKGHSRFVEIITGYQYFDDSLKGNLIILVNTLVEKDKSLVDNNLLPLFLCGYGGTLSKNDQKLLHLFICLESKGYDLSLFQPIIWGDAIANFYSIKKDNSQLLSKPKFDNVIELLDREIMKKSTTNFPINLELAYEKVDDAIATNDQYDPRFLLLAFYHLFSPHIFVKCHKFVTSGALSFCIAALSSECHRMRRLAYSVLARFYYYLDIATFPKDKYIWLGLLDCIRSGINKDNMKFSSIITTFFIHAIEIILHPNDILYSDIKSYLTNIRIFNTKELPKFYEKIHSSDYNLNRRYHLFILTWLTDGLKTNYDFEICHKRNVVHDLLLLFDSPLASDIQFLILKFLQKCISTKLGFQVLFSEYCFSVWLSQTISLNENTKLESPLSSIFDCFQASCITS